MSAPNFFALTFVGMTKEAIGQTVQDYIDSNATPAVAQRGKSLYRENNVVRDKIDWEKGQGEFVVLGSSFYNVQIRFTNAEGLTLISHHCDCPYEGFLCKHTIACLFVFADSLAANPMVSYGFSTGSMSSQYQTPSKPEKVAQQERRSSSEAYIIKNVETLDITKLNKHCSASSQIPHALEDFQVKFEDNNIRIDAVDNSYWQREHFTINMEVVDKDLSVTCSCDRRVKLLCMHAYAALYNFLAENENFFSELSGEGLREKALATMQAYGLPEGENWEDYLEMIFSREGPAFIPKGKYKGLMNPHSLNQELVQKITEANPEAELPRTHTASEVYHCGFYFQFDENFIRLEPMAGMLGKEGKSFAKKIKPLDRLSIREKVEYSESDYKLLRLAKELAQLSVRGDQENLEAATLALLHQAADLLENHPRLYLYRSSNYYPYQLRQKDLEHVQFVPSSPELKITLREKDDLITGEAKVTVNGKKLSLKSRKVQPVHELFVQYEDRLFLHSSLRDAEAFGVFFGNEVLSCTKALFPVMVENFWSKIARRYEVDFGKMKSYSVKKQKLSALKKELYLSDVGDFVIFKPVALYENDQRVEVLSGTEIISADEDHILRQQRNKDFEQEFENSLRELHPSFEKQQRSDFFHLSYDEFLRDQWFLKVFPKMQENNIEVLGWKDLKKFSVNPHPAKVSFNFSQKTDWFEAEANIAFGDTAISLEELKKHITPEGYVKLGDGSLGLLPEEWLRKFEKLFHHSEVKENSVKVSSKLFSLVDELFEEIDDEGVRGFIEEKKQKLLNFDKIQSKPIPKGIKATLRHYQEDGYNWLCFLDEFQWGGILADDMGLGKTLQVITFLKNILEKNSQTNLVIVPTSLLFNWEAELEKFAPGLKVHFYYGQDRVKDTSDFDDCQIVFTSYGLMTRDIELLREYSFNYIVLDESQAIKNPASKRYKAARLLKANNRITLTGTPIENNTFDLYAQMSFLNPGLLGSAAGFKKEYAKAIDKNRDADKAADLQKIIKPFVLRRTKEQVATELPDKIEDILYCEMKPAQRKVYDAFRNKYRDMLMKKIDTDGLAKSRFSVLEGLTKLRQICDTPEILSGDERYDSPSAKIDELLKHILEKTGKHKILVFSQFVKMLRVIEGKISEHGICYEYLDGQSSIDDRQKSVANFQENDDCRVFLISLKAGGTGLNLVAADYVYLVDPWWNPAVENQAIDRCYRIGQDKKVIAYRMICKNTVEEKIVALQEKKRAVASEIVTTDENVLKQLGKEDILELFG